MYQVQNAKFCFFIHCYAKCIVMLSVGHMDVDMMSVIMLNVLMLNVQMLNALMLNVLALSTSLLRRLGNSTEK